LPTADSGAVVAGEAAFGRTGPLNGRLAERRFFAAPYRTWFVQKFDKTKFPTRAVKITIANNVQRSYKVVDAVQLVGE
jgi:hypothetical protein